jgi:hypothetical protein
VGRSEGIKLRTALLVALATACGVGSARRAETVPPEALPIAADTIVVPFTQIPEAAWLDGRRWAVVESEHDAAVIADFATRAVTPVGGPKNPEIRKPFGLFTVGDTVFVRDWSTGKLTLWAGGNTLAGSIGAPAATRGILPRARDAAGQYYFEVPPVAGPDGSGNRDSIAVIRADPTMTRFDTVLRLSPISVAEVQRSSGKRFERLVFSGNDWWGVRPDGRLWVARVHANRVNTVANRKERRGEPLPDPVLEVTQPDRDRFIQSFPEEVRNTLQDLPFAPLKPPFERGFSSSDGMVWLRKSRAVRDSVRRYHVVDTTGLLARVFTTQGEAVIIAAGKGSALMAEQFRGGVRLMEIPLPAPPAVAAKR